MCQCLKLKERRKTDLHNRIQQSLVYFKCISVVYLLVTILIFNIVCVNSFFLSLFSVPAFFMIPVLIGDFSISRIFNKTVENEALHYFLSWLLGSLLLLTYGLILTIIGIFSSKLFSFSSLVMTMCCSIYDLSKEKRVIFFDFKILLRYLQFLPAVLIALLPLFIFKFLTGFPGNYSGVGYKFTYVSEAIVQRDIIILDQFTSYAPVFQTPLSIVSMLYNVDSYGLDWFAIFVIDLFFFAGIYTFLCNTSLDRRYSLLGAVISLYILIWDPNYFFPPIHDIQPRTLTLVMFPYALSSTICALKDGSNTRKQTLNVIITFTVSIAIFIMMRRMIHPELVNRVLIVIPTIIAVIYSFLLGFLNLDNNAKAWFSFSLLLCAFPIVHIFEGAYYIVVSSFFALSLIVSSKYPNIVKIFAYLFSGLLSFTLYLILNNIINVDSNTRIVLPSFLAAPAYYGYAYLPKSFYKILINAISPTMLYLLIVGVVIGIFIKTTPIYISSLLAMCLVLTIYFLPIPDIVRAGAALAPFVPYFVCNVLRETIHILSYVGEKLTKHNVKIRLSIRGKILTITTVNPLEGIYIALILIVITLSLTVPFQTYVNAKMSKLQELGSPSQLSLVTDYEYEMGLWIRDNTPKNAIVLSDPETMYIMAGISGRRLPIVHGMLIQDLQIPDLIRLYWIKFNILLTEDAHQAAFYASVLGEGGFPIIVISGRTEKWLSQVQFVSAPYNFGSLKQLLLSKFLEKNGPFRLLYSVNERIYAFTLRDMFLQKHSYKIFLVNYFSKYGNVTTFSSDLHNSTQYWYLIRRIIVGEVTTIVYEQYVSNGGNPCTIEWRIPVHENYSKIDVYVYNLHPLNSDSDAFFAFSVDGKMYIVDNFSYPIKYVFSVKPHDGFITFYGRGIKGKTTRLGTFIFVGWDVQDSK